VEASRIVVTGPFVGRTGAISLLNQPYPGQCHVGAAGELTNDHVQERGNGVLMAHLQKKRLERVEFWFVIDVKFHTGRLNENLLFCNEIS
jgi:hypothetical protein